MTSTETVGVGGTIEECVYYTPTISPSAAPSKKGEYNMFDVQNLELSKMLYRKIDNLTNK